VVQGLLASLAGKRIARHLPKVIGAWLAGLYDNDRAASRSVQESLTNVFPTEEKRNNVWKVYQASILEFVEDVILRQTPLTLSDERMVKPDDAQAKYARVVATAIHIFDRVLSVCMRPKLYPLQRDLIFPDR
jgi:E3 ubiquitin-protein ligase listerin